MGNTGINVLKAAGGAFVDGVSKFASSHVAKETATHALGLVGTAIGALTMFTKMR